MTVDGLLHSMSSSEISEWMAHDRLKDDKYLEELESKEMTDEQRSASLKLIFGGG